MTEQKRIIIQQATDLFTRKGCKAITMDDIAKSLGMSKRTIYEHFADKADLLTCCLESLFKKIDVELNRFMESDNIILSFLEFKDSTNSVLQRTSKHFFLDLKKYYPQIFKKVIETTTQNHEQKTYTFLEKGIKEGYFLKTVNKKLITLIIQELGQMLGNEEVFSPRLFNEEEIFRNGFVPFLRGISTTKGIETIDKYYNLH